MTNQNYSNVAVIELGAGGMPDWKDAHIYIFPDFNKEEILFTIKDLEQHYDKVYLANVINTKDIMNLGLEKFYNGNS